jgi:hypothetical protein
MNKLKRVDIPAMTTKNLNLLGTPNFGATGSNNLLDAPTGANGPAEPIWNMSANNINIDNVSKVYFNEIVPTQTLHLKNIMPVYKYNENKYIEEISSYINKTYSEHYSQNKFQATEFIIDSGHGTGFCMGNVMKYAQRYGKKGGRDDWRKDLVKVIHYAMMQLHVHDNEGSK